ncbi:MAG TPA: transporter substrate-binding domain-containing protein [Acidisphaera sp.]|nr:transporter substrate-binding domain-containing protein [Acidisphaera sp.]
MPVVTADVVRDLAPTGKLRTTINLGNVVLAQQDAAGALGGVSVDLARELARRLDVDIALVPFDTAAKAVAALTSGTCDVGFLAVDPVRAEELDFTAPYVIIEGTYLVPAASPLQDVADVDREGVRIAAGKGTAYDLHLSRSLRCATLVHAPSSAAAIELLLTAQTEAAAGVRQTLAAAAARRPGLRVMAGSFLSIQQAMTLPKGRAAGLAFLRRFVEEMKASGFVGDALARSGQAEATVAPAAGQGA